MSNTGMQDGYGGIHGTTPDMVAAHPASHAATHTATNAATLPATLAAKLAKGREMHKYDHGHVLVLSGGVGQGGAARLAARGALRIGAGLVTLGCPPSALIENAMRLDAVMCRAVAGPEALGKILEDGRINAVCLGPGLGRARAPALVAEVVRATAVFRGKTQRHTPYAVLDADALSAFDQDPSALMRLLHDGCVLTPHAGEFARLFPDIARDLAAGTLEKAEATRRAATRAGCCVLLKGADTIIAAPHTAPICHDSGSERSAPWLATAGSGDVLAGFITGLLARGFAPVEAAQSAVWLHVACARAFGPGLIAEDLPEMLPRVFAELGV